MKFIRWDRINFVYLHERKFVVIITCNNNGIVYTEKIYMRLYIIESVNCKLLEIEMHIVTSN